LSSAISRSSFVNFLFLKVLNSNNALLKYVFFTGRIATQPALPVPVTPEPVAIRHDPARDRRFAGRPIQDTLIA
jgi:hypothetical protein